MEMERNDINENIEMNVEGKVQEETVKEVPTETGETEGIDEKDKVIEELKGKIKEYEELIKRLAADFENYKRRVQKEKAEFQRFAVKQLLLDLLFVVDNFERALEAMKKENSDVNSIREGVELIYKSLQELLSRYGVRPIEAKGQRFDPLIHEALEVVEGDFEDNIVLEDIQKGYLMYDQVLRQSKVKVGKKKEGNNEGVKNKGSEEEKVNNEV